MPAPGAPVEPASAEPRALPRPEQLPAALRALLPPLKVSGSVWSDQPSQRLLMVGGEVRREGDALAPEVELVTIGPAEAVLRVRGTRFRLAY